MSALVKSAREIDHSMMFYAYKSSLRNTLFLLMWNRVGEYAKGKFLCYKLQCITHIAVRFCM